MTVKVNTFGEVRAEQDHQMLNTAFHEWQDYRSLFESSDRFIVVGRRGTGKSALTYRLNKDWEARQYSTIVVAPKEEEMIGFRPIAKFFGQTIGRIRAGVKVAWRYALLMEIGTSLLENYRTRRDVESRKVLLSHLKIWKTRGDSSIERLRRVLAEVIKSIDTEEERIAELATLLQINRVTEEVFGALESSNKKFVVLIDRLDEGYEPDPIGIGIVDGILYGVDELRLAFEGKLRLIVFLRDNIFRAIQAEDLDFSRNLEAQVLRLHWDHQELFYLVAKRIRQVFGVEKESDVKAWNAITANELHGRDGFKKCLQLTLYRPRDVIALLNAAFYNAMRHERQTLIEEDFLASAKLISLTRFDDLGKEYDSVIPGVKDLTGGFSNGKAKLEWSEVIQKIEAVMKDPKLSAAAIQHFKILSSPEEAVKALYGIGFIGLYDRQHGNFVYSHDGKRPDKQFIDSDVLMIHPCYWAALNLDHVVLSESDAENRDCVVSCGGQPA
jgi:GTPase SAR1 family protein